MGNIIANDLVQRVARSLGGRERLRSSTEIGDEKLLPLVSKGFLIVMLLVMLLLIENECVVNGDVHQVSQQVQRGKPCAAADERGGWRRLMGSFCA